MIREITIGQYYPGDSVIHHLDARVKIICTLFYLLSLFLFHSFAGYAFAISFFLIVLFLSKIPFLYLSKGLRPIFAMLVFTALFNLFWTDGHVFFQWGIFTLTWEGLFKMCYISLRLVFLILGASFMTLTTTPNQLTDGLERIFSPLKIFKAPVHEIALMMSIALRFIPILIEEMERIMKAQTARGADFSSGNLWERLKAMLPVLVPLFASAVRRAGDLALAMDARCYHGGSGRTKMYPLRCQKRDIAACLICALYFVCYCIIGYVSPV